MDQNPSNNWFEAWFDSPYYHLLYSNRNEEEAEAFIDSLVTFLQPTKNADFLDLACGKGRHAIYLNKKGYSTIGIDLSPKSIEFASEYENQTLQFYVHDMRKSFRINYFDYVLNLFTSFGYFDLERDDKAVINSIYKTLKPNGIVVIDFMNTKEVMKQLKQEEEKSVAGITFKISKRIENNFIIKHIQFSDNGKTYNYEERVKMLVLSDFEKYIKEANLKIINLFGNYQLQPFDENTAERLIIIAKKEN